MHARAKRRTRATAAEGALPPALGAHFCLGVHESRRCCAMGVTAGGSAEAIRSHWSDHTVGVPGHSLVATGSCGPYAYRTGQCCEGSAALPCPPRTLLTSPVFVQILKTETTMLQAQKSVAMQERPHHQTIAKPPPMAQSKLAPAKSYAPSKAAPSKAAPSKAHPPIAKRQGPVGIC